MSTFLKASIIIIIIALIDTVGSLLGFWTVDASQTERSIILIAEGLLLVALIINSFQIRQWVLKNSDSKFHHKIALLSLLSIAICSLGDIVNFNIPQNFYHYGSFVKHDYLIASTLFFGPGYLLLIYALFKIAFKKQGKKSWLLYTLIITFIVSTASYISMYNSNLELPIQIFIFTYGFIITLVAGSGLLFLWSFKGNAIPKTVWLIVTGCVLATVADVIIGTFWIYGNEGQGFFPVSRYANWVIYISSQALVILLPKILVELDQKSKLHLV